MKTRVPDIITCVNCKHNIVIKLYEVDTTINSAQGHFHTVHNPAEPPYTVYCINCGHFMTNDPDHAPGRPESKAAAANHGATTPKPAVPRARDSTQSQAQAKGRKTGQPASARTRQPKSTIPSATSTSKPRQKTAETRNKGKLNAVPKKSSSDKPSRPQRKKAK